MHDHIIDHLPYNSEFRSLAPDECEDSDDTMDDESVSFSESNDDSD